MELFDTIAVMFEAPQRWGEVTNYDKKKHYFMINRIMSIQYPVHANMVQNLKTNQIAVVDFWFRFVSKQFKRKPQWLFTSAKKKTSTAKKKDSVTDEMIKNFADRLGYEIKDVRKAIEYFGDGILVEVKEIDKILKG